VTGSYRTEVFATADGPLRSLIDIALAAVDRARAGRTGPVAAGGPQASTAYAAQALAPDLLPEQADDPDSAFRTLIESYAAWAIDVNHPGSVARMQCPPTAASVAADLVASLLNQSLHTWESGPFALELEKRVVSSMTELTGYGPGAGGTVTSGGSMSNIMAMLLARDAVLGKRFGVDISGEGYAAVKGRPMVASTRSTHFSVGRGMSITGLGEDALIELPTDTRGRMIPEKVDQTLRSLPEDEIPVMMIACAGATDLGWVDPLPELAEICRNLGIWLHSDAAYGGGMLFSDKLRHKLRGIEQSDSVTLDMHKFGWTPASASFLLVRDAATLAPLGRQATSLNAPDDVAEGFIGLYGVSTQATRRSDALKIAATFSVLGRRGLGAMVDACHDLAVHTAATVEAQDRLEVSAPPELSTVLFRYLPDGADPEGDAVSAFNADLRRELMRQGKGLFARVWVTRPSGVRAAYLKFTLLNPATTPAEIDQLVAEVVETADALAGGQA
jgi:L-2,4-diaminobutyrate decarboxylase